MEARSGIEPLYAALQAADTSIKSNTCDIFYHQINRSTRFNSPNACGIIVHTNDALRNDGITNILGCYYADDPIL